MNKFFFVKTGTSFIASLFFSFFLSASTADKAHAELMIYPTKEQTAEQQQKDEFECHQWAVGQTGYDPTKAPQTVQQEPAKKGGAVRGAAGGALVGLGIGAIAGDAGKGAAIGAGAGAVAGGVKQRQQNQQQGAEAQQAQSEQQVQIERYNKARSVCLEGRGYTVK